MVASKTFENTNASRKHGIHGKNMFDHTSGTGELAKQMKTQTHAYKHGIHWRNIGSTIKKHPRKQNTWNHKRTQLIWKHYTKRMNKKNKWNTHTSRKHGTHLKAHIESHLENMGASKTNGNTNASQKTRNQFEKLTRSIQTGEVQHQCINKNIKIIWKQMQTHPERKPS